MQDPNPVGREPRSLAGTLALILVAAFCTPSFAEDHERGERHEGHGLPAVVNNKTWLSECGACHVAYPPGLLPERSWRVIMDGLDRHFGENASLDAATRKSITEFLAANSADRSDARQTRRSSALPSALRAWPDRKSRAADWACRSCAASPSGMARELN